MRNEQIASDAKLSKRMVTGAGRRRARRCDVDLFRGLGTGIRLLYQSKRRDADYEIRKSVGFQEAGAKRVPRRNCALSVNTPLGYTESGLFVCGDSMVGGFCSSDVEGGQSSAGSKLFTVQSRLAEARSVFAVTFSAGYLTRAMTMRPGSLSGRAVQWCSKAIIRVRRTGRASKTVRGVAESAKNARRNDGRE